MLIPEQTMLIIDVTTIPQPFDDHATKEVKERIAPRMVEDADETDKPETLPLTQETALNAATAKAKEKAKVRDQHTKEKEKTTLPRQAPKALANPNSTLALTVVVPAITHAIALNAWRMNEKGNSKSS